MKVELDARYAGDLRRIEIPRDHTYKEVVDKIWKPLVKVAYEKAKGKRGR